MSEEIEYMLKADHRSKWNPNLAVSVAKVKYHNENFYARELTEKICDLKSNEYAVRFLRTQLALTVFDANRLEGTISAEMREGPTMKLILKFADDNYDPPPEKVSWDAEGGRENSESSQRQLYQCTQTVKYLLRDNVRSPLTFDLIIETHKIMMEGSYVMEGNNQVDIIVGRVRKEGEEVYADDYQFLEGKQVKEALMKLVDEYNHLSDKGKTHPIELATFLFYGMITIHPFPNGNGRLCRFFLSWSLMHDGFPFPVTFSSGHKKRRQHYIDAILAARYCAGATRGQLNGICLLSINRVLGNYGTNLSLHTNNK